jgi:hypothetical protein
MTRTRNKIMRRMMDSIGVAPVGTKMKIEKCFDFY